MPDLRKAYTILFLLYAYQLTAFSQVLDSVNVAQMADSSSIEPSLKPIQPIPDTVFLINGDKITGSIISFEESRLRIDAQSVGTITIRRQNIRSVSGGSRLYYVRDIRNEPYIGNIKASADTGEFLLVDDHIYGLRFTDIVYFFPVKSRSDTARSVPQKIQKFDKTHTPDSILLKNQERYTGRILSMEQGRIKIDAQGAGVVSIKWPKILTIKGGSREFKLEDQEGEIYIGRIFPSKDTGKIIVEGTQKITLMLINIVRIYPLEEDWYRGIKGSLGGGFSYSKSSEVVNINFDYNLYYVVKKWRFINNLSYVETSTNQDDKSVRLSVELAALYALKGKWVLSELNSFNRNDELGIKARISFGAGGGYNLILTEKQRLLALTGILQNTEQNIESSVGVSNFELPVSLQHTIYSFIRPDLSSTTDISYYKGLTESKRYRVDISTDITWEFIKWTKLKLSVYYDYDNKEVEGKPSKQDYGTVLSLLVDLK